MPHAILGAPEPSQEIQAKIGKVSVEWAWVDSLLGEMLAHFCQADPGSMYVITQNVASATVAGWLRTLTEFRIKGAQTQETIYAVLTQIDDARAERNTVVHGLWFAHEDPKFAWVQTTRWERSDVVKSELWSVADFDDLIRHIQNIQLMLGNLGINFGYLETDPGKPEEIK